MLDRSLLGPSRKNMMNQYSYSPFDEPKHVWANYDHAHLPEVIVVSWHTNPEFMVEQLRKEVELKHAELVPVTSEEISNVIDNLNSERIVACVMFVSSQTLEERSFYDLVLASKNVFLKRLDFRLFVHLESDLSFEKLKQAAIAGLDSASLLIESVHLSSNVRTDIQAIAQMLKSHCTDLPRTRHRLRRERWEMKWLKILSLLVTVLGALLVLSAGIILLFGFIFQDSAWSPWLYFIAGQVLYLGLLNLLTLGTKIGSGSFVRWTLILGSAFLVYHIPVQAFVSQWPYLSAGALTAILTDACVRSLAGWRRKIIKLDDVMKNVKYDELTLRNWPLHFLTLGNRSLHFLMSGPWFPRKSRVFISYSERSDWGRQAAERLHQSFSKHAIESFFAPKSIEHGSSWRHSLASELYAANVFIQLIDDKTINLAQGHTVDEHWPAVELVGASEHQFIGALPSIIIVCHSSVFPENMPDHAHPYIQKALEIGEGKINSSLSVINYDDELEEELAEELSKRYRWHAVSILPIPMASILELLLMVPASIFCTIGVFGNIAIWLILVTTVVLVEQHINIADWTQQHGYALAASMVMAYWLGFDIRFAVAARLQVWDRASGSSFVWRLIEVVTLLGFSILLVYNLDSIGLVYSILSVAFGIMLGSHYLRRAAEGKGWKMS